MNEFTTEEVDALWRLCQAVYGDKAKYQRYLDRDLSEMINLASERLEAMSGTKSNLTPQRSSDMSENKTAEKIAESLKKELKINGALWKSYCIQEIEGYHQSRLQAIIEEVNGIGMSISANIENATDGDTAEYLSHLLDKVHSLEIILTKEIE